MFWLTIFHAVLPSTKRASGTWAAANPDLARGFMVAYVRGVRDYRDAVVSGRDRDAVAQTLVGLALVHFFPRVVA